MTLNLDGLERIGKDFRATIIDNRYADLRETNRLLQAARDYWQEMIDTIRSLRNVLDAERQGGGETVGDTLIRLADAEVDEDWREWLRDHGHRINEALTPKQPPKPYLERTEL